jgi:hypothetical protein
MDLKPKITKQQEWTEYSIVEWMGMSFSLSFRNIFQLAVLIIACYWAWATAALSSEMQVAQTAYLYHGLKENGTLGGIVKYCEPVWVTGSFITQGKPFISWDCRDANEKQHDCEFAKIMNATLPFNLTNTGGQ